MLRRRPFAPVALLLGLAAAAGLIWPDTAAGSTAWSLAVMGVLFGYGAAVRRLLRIDRSFGHSPGNSLGSSPGLWLGELLGLGTVAWIFATGVLLAIDSASRVPLLVLAAAGLLSAGWELVTRGPAPPPMTIDDPSGAPSGVPVATSQERLARWVLGGLLAIFLLLSLVGSLNTRGNPFDDHVAYTAFTKRLLDSGDLLEPYSYRRISAYGGQTALLALAGLRGNLETTDLLDRGIFLVIATLTALGLMKRRGLHLGVAAAIVAFLLSLPDLSINSGAGWTGVTLFLAAYGFSTRDDLSPRHRLVLVLATCGAACTLRQNYLLPAGLFAALLLGLHVQRQAAKASWSAAWRAERGVVLLALAAAAALVVPYALATWRSSHTFLYPILIGNMNPLAPARPAGIGLLGELTIVLSNVLTAEPIRIWWVLFPFMLLARDPRPTRPWLAFLISSTIGLAYLLHGFLISDAQTLWRYAFGYMTPLAIVFLIELGDRLPFRDEAEREGQGDGEAHAPPAAASAPASPSPSPSFLRLPLFGLFLVWLAVLSQLVDARAQIPARFQDAGSNAAAALGMGAQRHRGLEPFYRTMQATIPAGASLAVLLDDPAWLDYRRNRVFNLDLPGFTAPVAMPSFTDAETWRRYFLSSGLRYLAFVDPTQSTYLFRRAGWVKRLLNDTELWRFMAARMIDTADSFVQLAATSRVLFHDQGMYLLDLGEGPAPAYRAPAVAEALRMDRFVQELSEQELNSNAWQLTSRSDVLFLPDGYGPSNTKIDFRSHAIPRLDSALTALVGRPPPEPAHRWLTDRSHIRVRGQGAMRLRAELWIDVPRLESLPRLTLSIDGALLGEATPDAAGKVVFDVQTSCTGWCEVYLVSSTVAEFWRLPEDLQVLKLLGFEWTKLGGS